MHCFRVPARLRADSDGLLQPNRSEEIHSNGPANVMSGSGSGPDSVSAMAVYNEGSGGRLGTIAHHNTFSSDMDVNNTPRSAQNSSSRPE